MTSVRFYRQNGHTTAFEAVGHAGYAEEGADIVCSAITSAVQLTHCFLTDILGLDVKTIVDEETARIYAELPKEISEDDSDIYQQAENAVAALMVHMTALKEDYPDFIDVMEV